MASWGHFWALRDHKYHAWAAKDGGGGAVGGLMVGGDMPSQEPRAA